MILTIDPCICAAIDDRASADVDDIAEAKNYVSNALNHLRDAKNKDKNLDIALTKPYGCSVKY